MPRQSREDVEDLSIALEAGQQFLGFAIPLGLRKGQDSRMI
jgi:hypothetical protein